MSVCDGPSGIHVVFRLAGNWACGCALSLSAERCPASRRADSKRASARSRAALCGFEDGLRVCSATAEGAVRDANPRRARKRRAAARCCTAETCAPATAPIERNRTIRQQGLRQKYFKGMLPVLSTQYCRGRAGRRHHGDRALVIFQQRVPTAGSNNMFQQRAESCSKTGSSKQEW